jgi:medium-chain acyl-[acyl-carrier-protein] hydrolase
VTLDDWVPYRNDNDNSAVRCRLFCLPHAGGAATFYRPWRHLLPPAIDVCPLELPGHGARIDEPPFREMSALVETLCGVLRPLLTVPFSLFGHSVGACLAYECARRLRSADGRLTVHLFVSGRRAPHRHPSDATLRALCDDDLLVALKQFGGIPPAVMARDELMTALLPAIRADLEMVEKYKVETGECVPCPITAFGGANDQSVDVHSLEAWRCFTSASFRVRVFAGGHFYFSAAREALGEDILQDLIASTGPALAPVLGPRS